MKADWLRLWHDMPTDPKWRVIARKSGQPLTAVLAVYTMLLVEASKAEPRGTIAGLVDEDIAAALDMDEEAVAAIRLAMLDRVHDGEKLSGWEKRQPKREDDTAAQRKREQRERQKDAETDVTEADTTDGHDASRGVTQSHAREEERRLEKTTPTAKAVGVVARRASRLSSDFVVPQDWLRWAAEDRRWASDDVLTEAASFVDYWSAKPGKDGAKLDWQATWRNWCRNSRRACGEPTNGAGAYARRPDG